MNPEISTQLNGNELDFNVLYWNFFPTPIGLKSMIKKDTNFSRFKECVVNICIPSVLLNCLTCSNYVRNNLNNVNNLTEAVYNNLDFDCEMSSYPRRNYQRTEPSQLQPKERWNKDVRSYFVSLDTHLATIKVQIKKKTIKKAYCVPFLILCGYESSDFLCWRLGSFVVNNVGGFGWVT